MKVQTTYYIYFHGSNPKGYGLWVFKIGEEVIFITGTYCDAKRQAIKKARELGVDTIIVQP